MSFECSFKDYVRMFTLFFFNFISLIFGIFVIFIGMRSFLNGDWDFLKFISLVWSVEGTEYSSNKDLKKFEISNIISIIVGICISVISFFGCCGALTKNTYCLKLYAAINLVLIGTLIILTVVGYDKFENKGAGDIEKSINDAFKSYDKYETPIDGFQTTFSCCGYNGVKYYNEKIFKSCCPIFNNCTLESIYQQDCNVIINAFVQQFISNNKIGKLILKISGGVGILLLTLVIFAATMADKIQDYRRGLYYGDLHNISFR